MCIKIMYIQHNHIYLRMYSNIKWQSSTMQNLNYFRTNLIHTHTHTGILFSHKKEWNNITCSNMDGSEDYHIKWSRSDKEGQIYDITYVWNLKHNTNEHNHKRETHSHTGQTCGGRGGGRGMGWELRVRRYKTAFTEWINSKVLLCSQRSMSNLVINRNGKEHER